MPLQNRVTPWGEILALPEHGPLTATGAAPDALRTEGYCRVLTSLQQTLAWRARLTAPGR
jgi:hypothetical protein